MVLEEGVAMGMHEKREGVPQKREQAAVDKCKQKQSSLHVR